MLSIVWRRVRKGSSRKLDALLPSTTFETLPRERIPQRLRQADVVLLPHIFDYPPAAADECRTIFPTKTIGEQHRSAGDRSCACPRQQFRGPRPPGSRRALGPQSRNSRGTRAIKTPAVHNGLRCRLIA